MSKGIWEHGYTGTSTDEVKERLDRIREILIEDSFRTALDNIVEDNVVSALKEFKERSIVMIPDIPGPIIIGSPWDTSDFDISINLDEELKRKMEDVCEEDVIAWKQFLQRLSKEL